MRAWLGTWIRVCGAMLAAIALVCWLSVIPWAARTSDSPTAWLVAWFVASFLGVSVVLTRAVRGD